MPAVIAASAARTCLGDEAATFQALLDGRSGVGPLAGPDASRLSVVAGYHVRPGPADGVAYPAGEWLRDCVSEVLKSADVDLTGRRVAAVVGTGLRELGALERWSLDCDRGAAGGLVPERLHFAEALRGVLPDVGPVLTVSNACSASGHALAMAEDLLELGDADAVVVAGTDSTTTSMLAMIGRVTDAPTTQVRPFDAARNGVLLGEGAAALLLLPEGTVSRPLARVLATGLSCDARSETAPDVEGISRAMEDALERAGLRPADVGLVIAHGTGTALNDPAEALALRRVMGELSPAPLLTALKGAVGHTSGGAALLGVLVAAGCLRSGMCPPVVGLDDAIPELGGLRVVRGAAVPTAADVVMVNAFGFGGVNAVTLLGRVA